MGFFGAIGKFFGASPKGEDMDAEDSAQEDRTQAALDKLVTGPKAFGNRTMSADDAENALRASGDLPAGWRLRESDSTSSGYRPTKAASKKVALLHAGEVAAAGFGGAAALGAGPLAGLGTTASLGTNAAIQGGLGAAQGAAQGGWKGALLGGALGAGGAFVPGAGQVGSLKNTLVQGGLGAARGLATGGGLKGALLGAGLGAAGAQAGRIAPSLTSSTLGQKAINAGVNTGLSSARTGSFNPYQAALGFGGSFLPDASQAMTGNPLGQRLTNFGGNQLLNLAGGGRFDPLQVGFGAMQQLPGRLGGGPVKAGKPYVVGEDGPEVVVPPEDSTVVPNEQTFAQRWGPLIAQGTGALGGIYAARQAQQNALQRSPEEQAAMTSVMGPGGSPATAASLMQESRPYITKPASYYQTLLNGSRGAMAQAVAPERAALNETYRGAQSQLATSGIRGAARDVLAGNLARDKASKVAGLTTGVQPAAASALAGLGAGLQGSAVPLYGSANTFYSNLLNSGLLNRQFGAKEGTETGAAAGKLIADLGTTAFGGKKKAPATQTSGSQVGLPVPQPPGQSGVLTGPGGFTVPPTSSIGPGDVDYGSYEPNIPNLGTVDQGMLPGYNDSGY